MSLIFRFAEFELNIERLELRRAGSLIRTDALVVRLLGCLVRNAGRLVTKDELVEQVWEGRAVADNAITVSMARLRKTLGHHHGNRSLITTLYGRGYRLDSDVVVAHVSDESAPLVSRVKEQPAPFVGRERVVVRLERALALAYDERGRACALIGEAGSGKTRVAEVFASEQAGTGLRVAWGYCREAGDTPPLWPWLQILREVFAGSSRETLEDELGPAAAQLITQQVGETSDASFLPPFLQGPARHRTFDQLVRAIALASRRTPWLLILEDVHRSDAASLELLGYLLDELPRMRVMLIATTRQQPGSRLEQPTQLMRVLGHRNLDRIVLPRLSPSDVKTYIESMLEDSDGRLAEAVFDKSEGNPFFMAELARQLRAAEHPDPSSLSVPEAALDLIWQSIEPLDQATGRVLSAAAVMGRSFELSRLQAVTEREPAELMASLDDALASGLLIAAPDSKTAFAFGHELQRAVLYDALSAPERRSWHLRIGSVLEKRRLAGEAVPPSELAYHAHAALPDIDARKTVDYCRQAAAASAAAYAGHDVVRYLRHALEALELVEGASVRLRMNLLFTSTLYSRSCDPRACVQALNEVLRLARERADGLLLVRGACVLNVHPGYQPLPGASSALEHALAVIGDESPALRAAGLAALAAAAPSCYSNARTAALLAEALPLARSTGNPPAMHAALGYGLWMRGGPAHLKERAALALELEQLARDNPRTMPVTQLDLAMFRAFEALQQGDQPSAKASLELAAMRNRTLGEAELAWHIERSLVIARVNQGDSAGALDALAKLRRVAEQRATIGTAPFTAFDRTVVAREITGTSARDEELRRALALEDSDPPSIWSMKVRALAAAGFTEDARAALQAVPAERLSDLPCDAHHLGTLGHLARAALDLHAHDYAAALYPLLARYPDAFAGHVSFLCEGSISQLLGALAHALGRRTQAVAHLERGIRLNDNAGFALCAAEARLELARCLLTGAAGTRSTRAEALAREAQATILRSGARRLTLEAADVVQLAR